MRWNRRSAIAILALTVVLACPAYPLRAQTLTRETGEPAQLRPLELVKSSFSRVLSAEGGQRQVEVRRATQELFDFNEMARRILGAHWEDGSELQHQEFVRLFTDMLGRAYLSNIGNFPSGSVTFQEESVTGPFARVSSRMAVGRRGDTSIDYLLMQHDGRWAIYDVVLDGVGLVSSYRSQFHSILRTSSFAQLLERLRSREADVNPHEGP
jgi:phospholipid transport system substrate-binding protein